jgi:hypothetical protein
MNVKILAMTLCFGNVVMGAADGSASPCDMATKILETLTIRPLSKLASGRYI